MSPATDSLVGSVVSQRYQLVRLIGEGGMGCVFEAIDRSDGGRYALKILHPEYAEEAAIVERLYAEAEAASRLSHPNIARYFGFGQTDDGSSYLVMEMLEGVPLSRYLAGGKAYQPGQAVPILQGVLSGLSAAHGHGIVHRDLKPDNIFLAGIASGVPTPKLLDFGIAKILDAVGKTASKTKTGMLLGTPGYMSPEQIRNAKAVDTRTDLWAAGVVLYEMLTGRAPFPAPTEMAKLTAILGQDPVPIDQAQPQLGVWRDFFARALAKEPERRFRSAEEMSSAMLLALDPTGANHAARLHQRLSMRPSISSVPPTQGFDEAPASFQPTMPQVDDGGGPPRPSPMSPMLQGSRPYLPVASVSGGPAAHAASALPLAVPAQVGPRGQAAPFALATPSPYPAAPVQQGGYASRPALLPAEMPPVSRQYSQPMQVVAPASLGFPGWMLVLGILIGFLAGLSVGILVAHR